jgi:hypothetical protein
MLTEQIAVPRAGQVAARGWSHGRLPMPASGQWDEFAKAWEDLPADAYVTSKHHTTRNRRIGRLLARDGDTAADVLAPDAFFQSTTVNSVYGGKARVFDPISLEVFDGVAFRDTIRRDLDLVRAADGGHRDWLVTVHLVRVTAAGDESSAPAPEGRHQDGHEFIVMHLIGRQNCAGGDSVLFHSEDADPVLHHTMVEPMETLALNDREMQHEVTPISPAGAGCAIRDLMIIDFDSADHVGTPVAVGTVDLGVTR